MGKSNMYKTKTIFCDIDGTLIKHRGSLLLQLHNDPEILDGVHEKFDEWDRKCYNIILTTGRRESLREITEKQLSDLGIFYDHLLMGIGGGQRILINDLKADSNSPENPTAIAINLVRNEGIGTVEIKNGNNIEKTTRPWGNYEVLLDDNNCKVKKIIIKPGQSPSYQMHYKRSEKWFVVSGIGKARIDDVYRDVKSGDIIDVPVKTQHNIKNISQSDDLIFIEIQSGTYFGEDDIVRLEDAYGRV